MRQWSLADAPRLVMTLGYWCLMGAAVLLHWALWGHAIAWPSGLWEWVMAVVIVLGLTTAVMFVHEAVHALAFLLLGARPRFGAVRTEDGVPYLSVGAEGHMFSRASFTFVLLAPVVLLGGAFAIWVALLPWGGWMVIPAAVHLAGCVGDLVMLTVVAYLPSGTRIEDTDSGMAFHPQ